eukprot:5272212-Lingulodinium_polyedra.AAC.1
MVPQDAGLTKHRLARCHPRRQQLLRWIPREACGALQILLNATRLSCSTQTSGALAPTAAGVWTNLLDNKSAPRARARL